MHVSSRTRLALLALAGLGAATALAYPTDEKRVRKSADALIAAANVGDSALVQALEAYAVERVSVRVSELAEPLVGRAALVEAVREARKLEPQLHFQLDAVDVRVEGGRARLEADVVTSVRPEVPELRRPRRSSAVFEKRGDTFRLVTAEVGGERLDQPEARP